ncbi:hypothetical protein PV327_002993 [Microctonus hyperodae]|uniref:Galactokinase n=1 Tax=Microctonus hyperodae TaxID=165561 RepID=A0AA39G331_MICHY|nr:hypothetical protein PV327_002993 [Microctonus hyperodae]
MENSDPIPILEADDTLKDRLAKLSDHFLSRFKHKATFFARVPGRVNLIGDHIDYSGFAVCPMAIEQDVIVAASQSNNSGLYFTNLNNIYPDYHCESLFNCRDDLMENNGLQWYKYLLCGIVGALEIIPKDKIKSEGLNIAIWGIIPLASGLSSSSALVSAAVLTLIHMYQHEISRKELALISAKAERHIGTQGGAMDQAIAFLATAGAAKLIEFNPLQTTDVILPNDAVFVIANSMVKCNKAATLEFNTRVEECKTAVKIIAKQHFDNWNDVNTLGELQKKLGTNLLKTLKISEAALKNENPILIKRCKHVFEGKKKYWEKVS